MCMFRYKNKASFKALSKGVEYFECGGCPECLQKKSRKWALRCSMEAKVSPGVMVTLTYDSYKIKNGQLSNEENPIDPNIPLSKDHAQKFIKRLRKHFSDRKIKYILTAERGKKGRAHYHALLFNVQFNDLQKYKSSKRNNIIYKSKTLTDLWSHGICTVDCINLSAKTARYCTKYCAKDNGQDETFMLFSRGIGDKLLKERFNGKSYWIDGREYAIPREIWQWYIENKYDIYGYSKYRGLVKLEDTERKIYNGCLRVERKQEKVLIYLFSLNRRYLKHLEKKRNFRSWKIRKKWYDREQWFKDRISHYEGLLSSCDRELASVWRSRIEEFENSPIHKDAQDELREQFQEIRDFDDLYQEYIEYWKHKNIVADLTRPSDYDRILALPHQKYWSYIQKAIACKARQMSKKRLFFTPPRSNSSGFELFSRKKAYTEKSFAPLSRHYTANDTLRNNYKVEYKRLMGCCRVAMERNATKLEYFPF